MAPVLSDLRLTVTTITPAPNRPGYVKVGLRDETTAYVSYVVLPEADVDRELAYGDALNVRLSFVEEV